MATAVCHRQEVGTWSSIFPADQLTEQKSAFFVKKLLAVSVSYLTYLRNIFPENAFCNRSLDELELKILHESSDCPGANKVCQWVRSCFEALDEKYLNSLVLGLYVDPSDPNTLLESYSFKFNYEDGIDLYHNNEKILTSSTDNTKKSTVTLLRTLLVLTQGLNPLPDGVMMTMKLYFNEDTTPPDYHPPGFVESTQDEIMYEDDTVNIKVGEVATKFHTVKMRIRTNRHNFELSPDTKEIVAELSDGSPEGPSGPETVIPGRASPANTEAPEYEVDCVCGSRVEDGMIIVCTACDKWSHGLCYSIIESSDVPESHICAKCPGQCTDSTFIGADKATVQATALWRRTLYTLTEVKKVKDRELAQRLGIGLDVAKKVIIRLVNERFLRKPPARSKQGYTVNQAELKNRGIPHYFALLSSTQEMTQETQSLKIAGEKRKLDSNGEAFELSSSQSWTSNKRLRSADIKTPIRLN